MDAKKKTVPEAMNKAGKPVKGAEVAAATGIDAKEVGKIIAGLTRQGKITSPKMCYDQPA